MSSNEEVDRDRTTAVGRARRDFIKNLPRDALRAAANAAGTMSEVQRSGAEAIGVALGMVPNSSLPADGVTPRIGGVPMPADIGREGFNAQRTPAYRIAGESLLVLDQRRYPDKVEEVACGTFTDVAGAMLGGRVSGAPLLGVLAGYGIWLAATGERRGSPATMATRLRTAGAVLRGSRNAASIDSAVYEMIATWDGLSDVEQRAIGAESALKRAADEIAERTARDLSSMARLGVDAMPSPVGDTLNLLTIGASGWLAGTAAGGAAGIAAAMVDRGQAVHVWVLETRPNEGGARAAAWHLALEGVRATVAADNAAAWLLNSRAVDAVIVNADRMDVGASVTATLGTYGLAVLAREHAVPCFVAVPISVLPGDGRGPEYTRFDAEPFGFVDPRRPSTSHVGSREGTRGRLQDLTPARLVDAFLTGEGVVHPPFHDL